ncbi:flotillin family protein [Marivirga harenae]|uniref:flotillin family protein n=1 Tax=Marivirga harenae TaxID=2010992 RepID=UPI0026DEE49C|nr:flotillin family protein [Marivirga harenae]WKV12018.1 flotillin family protein [Marivirga harenae]
MIESFYVAATVGIVVLFGLGIWLISMYKKVSQGRVLVRTGQGGVKIFFNAGMVIPILHKEEIMDISVKKLEISRMTKDGLICKDNMRADIKVAFFVRVNKSVQDIVNVAQTIGCERASDHETLESLFEAKFSEALKSVGKKFEFIELYEARREFRNEIIDIIGTDLNGYVLDDCAIDYLEQTNVMNLDAENILDAEGIKKITELTAAQKIKSNLIRRDEEKTIKKQDVEAREAILELEKQQKEKEESQRREIETIIAREQAEIDTVSSQEKLKSEEVRIRTEEQLEIQQENKLRQVIIAAKNKERAEAVETERVQKDRDIEATERERIVSLAQIEKEKAVEIEKRNIQDAIRERVVMEKTVVEEQEKIKDVVALKEANRLKDVAIINADKDAQQNLIEDVKAAEAREKSAKFDAQKVLIEAGAKKDAADMEAEARKIIADAKAKEEATIGMSEAQVMHAKADANERQGTVDAVVIEKIAEAKRKQGLAEASVIQEKAVAEAKGIQEKAGAMKQLNDAGKEHEEFRLKLSKEKEVQLAEIGIQKDIADSQAKVLAEAFKTAKIDIVGGDNTFFENLVRQVSNGKGIDKLVENSNTITNFKDSLLGGIGEDGKPTDIIERIKGMATKYGISAEDIKNLSIAALIARVQLKASDEDKTFLSNISNFVSGIGLDTKKLN